MTAGCSDSSNVLIQTISHPQIDSVLTGFKTGPELINTRIELIWKQMGEEMGFDPATVKQVDYLNPDLFTAEPIQYMKQFRLSDPDYNDLMSINKNQRMILGSKMSPIMNLPSDKALFWRRMGEVMGFNSDYICYCENENLPYFMAVPVNKVGIAVDEQAHEKVVEENDIGDVSLTDIRNLNTPQLMQLQRLILDIIQERIISKP